MNKMMLIKSLLTGILYDSKLYPYLNDVDKVRECYSCLKMIIKTHLHVGFFTRFFVKHASPKRFYLYVKQLQSSTIFKQKNNQEVSCD